MKAVHITRYNHIEGIKKHGIKRGIPLLSQYDKLMKKDYRAKYDPKKGLVFAIGLDSNIERFVKDFAYWDMWGKPRNIAIKDNWCDTYKEFDILREMGTKAFSSIPLSTNLYIPLLIEVPDHPLYDGWYKHQQSNDMEVHWNNMDTRYEHNDKPLVLINHDVPVKNIICRIGTASTSVWRNNRINVSVHMKTKEF
jgi:hypothetical protein